MLVSALLSSLIVLAPADSGRVATVRVDSARHLVVVTAGPWDIESAHASESGPHAGHSVPRPERFTWPMNAWVRGARLRLVSRSGKPLQRDLLHHIEVVNLGRRELLYPVAERLLAFGSETEDIHLPSSIGIPVTGGMPMMMTIAWMNHTGVTVHDAMIEITMEWLPSNIVPHPVSVLPVTLGIGGEEFEDTGIDLTPGLGNWTKDFLFPIGGRILAAGGHLHDYGTGMALSDISRSEPHQVLSLSAKRDSTGHVLSIARLMPGVMGEGIHLSQGGKYRVAGSYLNPTTALIPKGGMISLVLLYAPEHIEGWPAVNTSDRLWIKDVAYLSRWGADAMEGMAGMDMGHH